MFSKEFRFCIGNIVKRILAVFTKSDNFQEQDKWRQCFLTAKKLHFLYGMKSNQDFHFCANLFRNWEKYFFIVVVHKLYFNSSMSWYNREQSNSTQKNMITVKDNDS